MRTSRSIIVPRAIADLHDFPQDLVVRELQLRFDDSKPSEKLSLAYALADYGEGDAEFLVSRIADAPAAECSNFVAALRQEKDEARKRLSEQFQDADEKATWNLKGRLAVQDRLDRLSSFDVVVAANRGRHGSRALRQLG